METRTFGKTGMQVSPLGFGVMRLPMKDGGKTVNSNTIDQVDVETSIKMIHDAIDAGVNYFDTAYNYIGGFSERILGQALQGGLREKVCVATKSPAWLYKAPEDFDRFLDEQLERLQTTYIDNYLLHSMNGGSWKKTVRNNAIEGMQRAKASGKVRNIGFSFHDDLDLFEEILNAAEWDFCQIQLNYYDQDYQAGLKGMRMAAERGLAVVVMEPLRGGLLVNLPKEAQAAFADSGYGRSNVEWALDWLWNMPEVSCVLSGMSTPEQLQQNVGFAQKAKPGMLSAEEQAVIAKAKAALDARAAVPCTGCNYCVDMCPNKIAIPYNFRAYNMGALYDDMELAKDFYQNEVSSYGRRADSCTSCGSCEEICPQHISISEWMPKVDELLGE
jgi:uncharacterized protein